MKIQKFGPIVFLSLLVNAGCIHQPAGVGPSYVAPKKQSNLELLEEEMIKRHRMGDEFGANVAYQMALAERLTPTPRMEEIYQEIGGDKKHAPKKISYHDPQLAAYQHWVKEEGARVEEAMLEAHAADRPSEVARLWDYARGQSLPITDDMRAAYKAISPPDGRPWDRQYQDRKDRERAEIERCASSVGNMIFQEGVEKSREARAYVGMKEVSQRELVCNSWEDLAALEELGNRLRLTRLTDAHAEEAEIQVDRLNKCRATILKKSGGAYCREVIKPEADEYAANLRADMARDGYDARLTFSGGACPTSATLRSSDWRSKVMLRELGYEVTDVVELLGVRSLTVTNGSTKVDFRFEPLPLEERVANYADRQGFRSYGLAGYVKHELACRRSE